MTEHLPPRDAADTPKSYRCVRAQSAPHINGRLDKPFWADASWTDDFVDIQGDPLPTPRYRTRAKMLWDEHCLYIGAELEEPHVWGTLTEHDSVIFHDNDFEVFLDPDGDNHNYVELEINALNTTWDLLLPKPYRDGGPAVNGFELHGLQTAVWVDGTANDPSDEDRGWTVEIAIPWSAIRDVAGCPCPPSAGDHWRINFSRVQWEHTVQDGRYIKIPGKPEDNWVWSPQGVIDMHRPERWGILHFAESASDVLLPYPGLSEREALMDIYHRQVEFRKKRSRWALGLAELDLATSPATLHVAGDVWEATLGDWRVAYDSKITRRRSPSPP
jgi:hypothetical protein